MNEQMFCRNGNKMYRKLVMINWNINGPVAETKNFEFRTPNQRTTRVGPIRNVELYRDSTNCYWKKRG